MGFDPSEVRHLLLPGTEDEVLIVPLVGHSRGHSGGMPADLTAPN
jgi:hypothetical protein